MAATTLTSAWPVSCQQRETSRLVGSPGGRVQSSPKHDVNMLTGSLKRPAKRHTLRITSIVEGQSEATKAPLISLKKAAMWTLPILATPYVQGIMTPYVLSKIALIGEQPSYIGIPLIDKTYLALYPQIFLDMISTEAGVLLVGTFLTWHLSWFTAASIESSRGSSQESFNLKFPGFVYSIAVLIASFIIVPMLWMATYVDKNPKLAKRPRNVENNDISSEAVAGVLAGVWPFLVMNPLIFFSGTDSAFMATAAGRAAFGWAVTSEAFSPLLSQLIFTPFKGKGVTEASKGHMAAAGANLLAAGVGILFQAMVIATLLKHPEVLTKDIPNLLVNQEGNLHGPFFMLMDDIVLILTFALIPFFEAGPSIALRYFLAVPFVGPAAAQSFYFSWREMQLAAMMEAETPELGP